MDKNVEPQRFRRKHKMWKSNFCIISTCHPLILVSGGLLLESSLAATHMMQVCYYLVRMERWEWTFRYTTMALRWNWNLCRWRASNFDLCWHSWPLSSEGSLACHTYCDTGHPFIMVISEDPWYSHLLLSVWQWSCHYLFLLLRSVAAGMRTPNLPLARRTL